MADIDMRVFAQNAGANITFQAGSTVFAKGDAGNCMYVVQSGVIEMVIGDKILEVCGPNEAIGFMSMIDLSARSSTARVRETAELSILDQRKFRFMIDEIPNFSMYIMQAMARRIRGMSKALWQMMHADNPGCTLQRIVSADHTARKIDHMSDDFAGAITKVLSIFRTILFLVDPQWRWWRTQRHSRFLETAIRRLVELVELKVRK